MIQQGPVKWIFICDACLSSGTSDSIDYPPPGFVTMGVRCCKGVGVAVHVCCECLPAAAERIAEGRMPNGDVLVGKG